MFSVGSPYSTGFIWTKSVILVADSHSSALTTPSILGKNLQESVGHLPTSTSFAYALVGAIIVSHSKKSETLKNICIFTLILRVFKLWIYENLRRASLILNDYSINYVTFT